ncbi:MAG: hypothetical protein PHH14_00805 [Candidatus Margulisbacteria bacterium]|nr:hypothetical protein [Candidatus Margulisiibacteriota bacterium]
MGTGIGIGGKLGFSLQAKIEKFAMRHPRYAKGILGAEALFRKGSAQIPFIKDVFSFSAGGITLRDLIAEQIRKVPAKEINSHLDFKHPHIGWIIEALSKEQIANIFPEQLLLIIEHHVYSLSAEQIGAITKEQSSAMPKIGWEKLGGRVSSFSDEKTTETINELAKSWPPEQMLKLLEFIKPDREGLGGITPRNLSNLIAEQIRKVPAEEINPHLDFKHPYIGWIIEALSKEQIANIFPEQLLLIIEHHVYSLSAEQIGAITKEQSSAMPKIGWEKLGGRVSSFSDEKTTETINELAKSWLPEQMLKLLEFIRPTKSV